MNPSITQLVRELPAHFRAEWKYTFGAGLLFALLVAMVFVAMAASK